MTPSKQTEKDDSRHTVCDNDPDCNAAHDVPSVTTESSPSPVKDEVRTRLGSVIHMSIRLRFYI